MMEISKYIIQILKEQEQVIVPGLGSFITEYKSAKIHPIDHNFSPPVKEIVFDNFTPEDDFLYRKIAESENFSIEKAIVEVRNFTDNLITEIQNYKVATIEGLGSFNLNVDNTITFKAAIIDISDESFGLEEFKSPAVVRNDFKERAVLEMQKAKEYEDSVKKRNKKYFVIAISIVFLSGLIFLVFFTDIFRNLIYDSEVQMERPNQEINVQNSQINDAVKIDTAKKDSLVDNQANEITNAKSESVIEKQQPEKIAKTEPKPEVVKENPKEASKYYLVAGSFKIQENAEKRVVELKNNGYNTAGFLQPNNKGLYVVYYNSFIKKEDAEKLHQKVMKEENPESWVMKK